jgi:hypothetical protein
MPTPTAEATMTATASEAAVAPAKIHERLAGPAEATLAAATRRTTRPTKPAVAAADRFEAAGGERR